VGRVGGSRGFGRGKKIPGIGEARRQRH
jgi:hypothetical protein